jgi:5'(3')-deoxyribonucleotidase
MDGVIVDFLRGALSFHNRSDLYSNYPSGIWNIESYLDIKDFWKFDTYDFWCNLEKTPDADYIVAICLSHFDEVYTVTTPTRNSHSGKIQWVINHYPALAEQIIFIRDKELLANSETFLVDDKNANYDKFRLNGGNAYLYPRPWNRKFHDVPDLKGHIQKWRNPK